MFDHDERIIVLAQNVRRRANAIVVDTPFARDCTIEGEDLRGLLYVLRQGHLRTTREMKHLLRKEISMSVEDANELIEGLFDLHLITTNRRMPLTMEEISMNPSGMCLAPRTPEDMRGLHAVHNPTKSEELPSDATPLMKLLARRRSVRFFSKQEMTDEQATSLDRVALAGWGEHRSIPSAGGLYPCRVVTLVRRGGAYHSFDGQELTLRNVKKMFVPNAPCMNAPVYMIIVADYERSTKKYGARGWRYAMLEAGHIAQNIELHALELGLAACEIGAFKESDCIRVLKLSEMDVPLIVVAGGYETELSVSKSESSSKKLINAYVGSTGIVNSIQVRKRDPVLFPDAYSVRAHAAVPKAHRGKGMDVQIVGAEAESRDHAIVKAIAEGVERFSTGWIPAPERVCKIASLDDVMVIAPEDLQRYAPEQRVPSRIERFSRDSVASWYKMRSWGGDREAYIAGDFLFYPYGEDDQKLYSYATSNGVAAHVERREALWRATGELLERESLLAWWFSGAKPCRLSRKAVAHLDRFLHAWKTRGVELRFLNITTSIPTVCVVGIDRERRSTYVATASGIDLSATATHACSEVLRSIAGLEEKAQKHMAVSRVRSVEDHLKCFAGGYAFDYVDAWSSGLETDFVAEKLPKVPDSETWLRWVVDNVGPLFYYEHTPPRDTFHDQLLVVIRSIIPGVASIKFGYGEQDLGLPRFRELLKQCREAGSTTGRLVPKLHPLA